MRLGKALFSLDPSSGFFLCQIEKPFSRTAKWCAESMLVTKVIQRRRNTPGAKTVPTVKVFAQWARAGGRSPPLIFYAGAIQTEAAAPFARFARGLSSARPQ